MMTHWLNRIFSKKIPVNFVGYAHQLKTQNQGNTPINQVRFVVLDTETTGLNPKQDRILSVAAVEVVSNTIAINRTFEVQVQQPHYNNESIAIHQITPGVAASGQIELVAMQEFIDWLQGAVIIGLHVDFDFAILSNTCQRTLGIRLQNKKYELIKLLPRVDNHFAHNEVLKPQELGLEALCERYKIPIADRHTAAGDALATALLFIKLIHKLEGRGVRSLNQLLAR